MITKKQLAAMIDHTNVKAYVTEEDMFKLCDEAMEYGFAMVAINSGQTKRCYDYLRSKGSLCHVGAAIGFPLGQMTIASKVFETKDALENGADEIDYVINITELKKGNYAYIEDEMKQITDLTRSYNKIIKVIFETCYLSKEEIVELCKIASKVKPDFIKTSTGMGTGGATLEDVKLMRANVSADVKVKASGGVRTTEEALAFIEAGAERIGTSKGCAIVDGLAE